MLNADTALGTGQLVKDDFFTLFEAVGALEVRISTSSGYRRGHGLRTDSSILGIDHGSEDGQWVPRPG